ncbi:hypothetical protein ACTXT7_009278 [Hymenolepis weldensis]
MTVFQANVRKCGYKASSVFPTVGIFRDSPTESFLEDFRKIRLGIHPDSENKLFMNSRARIEVMRLRKLPPSSVNAYETKREKLTDITANFIVKFNTKREGKTVFGKGGID